MNFFFVFFVSTWATLLPNGVRKFRDFRGENQGHRIQTELLWPVAARQSEIGTWSVRTGNRKVHAANRTHQPDLTCDDLEGQLQGRRNLKLE